MNQIMTMVGKDGRRIKWWVALFLAVTVVKFGIAWWLSLGAARVFQTWTQVSDVVKWLMVAEVVLTWLIAGALVLEDPLVGAGAAWRTRPISVWRLLVAKVTGALLWLWGPSVVLGLPWWWASGLGGGDMLRAAALGLVTTVAVIAPSFFVASLVDSMGRFVLWSIPGYAGMVVVPLAVKTLAEKLPGGGGWGVYLGVVGLLAGVGYFLRLREGAAGRVFRGAAVAVIAVIAVIAVVGWRRVTVINGPKETWIESKVESASNVTISWRETRAVESGKREPQTSVNSWLNVEGVPAGMALDIARTRHEWTREGRATIVASGQGYASDVGRARRALKLPLEKSDPETVRWKEARQRDADAKRTIPRPTSAPRSPLEPMIVAHTTVPPSVGAQLRSVPASYRVTAELRLVQPVEWANVPLRAEAAQRGDGHGLRVTAITRLSRGLRVEIVEARALPWDFLDEYNQGRWRRPAYYGLDRESERLVNFNGDRSTSIWIGGVELQAQTMVVSAPMVIREGTWTLLDTQWEERMRLVLLRWDEVARVTREARTEKFVVTP